MTKKTQVQKFKEAARALQTDDSERRFNERLGKIARAKPSALRPSARKSKKPGK